MGMIKPLALFVIVVAVVAAAIVIIRRQEGQGPSDNNISPPSAPGALPTWGIGSKWTYQTSSGVTYSLTLTKEQNVSDEACYVLEGTISPSLSGWQESAVLWRSTNHTPSASLGSLTTNQEWGDNITIWRSKTTLDVLRKWVHGSDSGGHSRSDDTTFSYDNRLTWPLAVGSGPSTYIHRLTTAYNAAGDGEEGNETLGYTIQVDSKETVATQAGTFECYKLVVRNAGGQTVETLWYSDTAKIEVKRAIYGGENTELVSYELH